MSRARLINGHGKEREQGLSQCFASFDCFVTFVAWDTTGPRNLRPSPLEWALMFVFLILAAAVGGWTIGVCIACPAKQC